MSFETKLRVLFIEMEEGHCEALELYLKSLNPTAFEIQAVHDENQLSQIAGEEWDVIIADVHRDKPEKKALLESARKRIAHIPVIDLGEYTRNTVVKSSTAPAMSPVKARASPRLSTTFA